jgi:hypothetical protein
LSLRLESLELAALGLAGWFWRASELQRNTVMTIEILHLTAQIQNWLNVQVARHLAAQAAKLSH